MCVIVIKSSTDTSILGRGWQAVSEDASTASTPIPADCGMLAANGATATGGEIPGGLTDPSLGDAGDGAGY